MGYRIWRDAQKSDLNKKEQEMLNSIADVQKPQRGHGLQRGFLTKHSEKQTSKMTKVFRDRS